MVPDDPTREVPNPAWAAADAKLVQAEAHVSRLQAEYGLEALMSVERRHRTMRGFKIAKGRLNAKIWKAATKAGHSFSRPWQVRPTSK